MEPLGENPQREQYFSSRFDVLREGQSSEEGVNEESHINHIFISSASWMDWIGSASYFSIPSYLFPPTQPSPFIISIPSYIYLLRRRQGRSAWMGRQRMNLHLILICQSWRRNKARETVILRDAYLPQKGMNFRKSSERPLTPPPHFRKVMLQFF